MSFEHAQAVRKSNLYEYAGISKSLLERIAFLIVGPPKEGEKPDPKLPPGWCVTSQDTLAAMQGCSEEEVNRQVAKFERDGWLTIKKFRDEHGHKRCHYTITPEQLKAIEAHKMLKDANGDYIRAKRPKQARDRGARNLIWQRESFRKTLQTPGEPLDESSKGQLTIGQQANCESVKKPLDDSSMYGVSSSVPSLEENMGRSLEKTKEPEFLPTKKEGKSKTTGATAPVEAVGGSQSSAASRTRSAIKLKDKVAEKLRSAGCPPKVLALLEHYDKFATVLNGDAPGGCSNPVNAYRTFLKNNPHLPFAMLWVPALDGTEAMEAAQASLGVDWRSIDDDLERDPGTYIP